MKSHSLGCEQARIVMSAAIDGEASPAERVDLDEHLAGCPSCTTVADRMIVLGRGISVRPAESVPDLVTSVTSRVRPAQLGRGGWIRPALVWVAIVIFVQNIGALVMGNTDGAETHLARHLGAFGVALAIGFAYAAWRPHRAFGMLPFVAALVATIIASTGFDVIDGGRTAVAEAAHIGELVGLVLLWMLAGSPGWRGLTHRRRASAPA